MAVKCGYKNSIGKIRATRHYGNVEILAEGKNSGFRLVKFLNTGAVKEVSIGSLSSGIVKDTSENSVKINGCSWAYGIGSVHKTTKCGDIEIVDYIDRDNRTVKFLNTGVIKNALIPSIKSGAVNDPTTDKFLVGAIYPTNKCGDIEIIAKDSPRTRIVRFVDTGRTVGCVQLTAIKNGLVGNRPRRSEETIHAICNDLKYGLMTLKDISIKFSVSPSMVSQINGGRINSCISKLYKHNWEKKVRGTIKKGEY